jgi:hypothetical protein
MGDLGDEVLRFQQGLDLKMFLLGQVRVASHKASSLFLVKAAQIFLHLSP